MPAPEETVQEGSGGTSAPPAALSDGKVFDAAFDAALKAQEAGGGEGTEAEETTEDETESEEESPEEEQPAEDTEGEGQPDETPAGTEDTSDEGKLLAQLPAPLRKQWNKLFTEKSQEIAASKDLLEAIRTDPVKAAEQIIAFQKAKGGTAQAEDEAPTTNLDTIESELAKVIPADQAKALMPIFAQLVEAATGSLRTQLTTITNKQTTDHVDAEIKAFGEKYSDYKELEPKMSALLDDFPRAPHVPIRKHMEMLRTLALGDKAVTKRTAKTVKKMVEAAKSQVPTVSSVPSGTVQPKAGAILSWDESLKLAEEGVTIGKGISR